LGVPIRILGINGSIRAGSSADRALRFCLSALESAGAQCETFEIGSLPVLDGRSEDHYPATVAAWRAACEAADAFVIAVPSYHGAAPGGLKNALDFVDVPQVGGKPFAVIGIAGGDAEPGVTDVVKVMRHIGAIAGVPDVVISRASQHWGPGPEPTNESVKVAIQKVAADLLALAALRSEKKLPQP
jgi:NAD(P)H-dependent FMN reductase